MSHNLNWLYRGLYRSVLYWGFYNNSAFEIKVQVGSGRDAKSLNLQGRVGSLFLLIWGSLRLVSYSMIGEAGHR